MLICIDYTTLGCPAAGAMATHTWQDLLQGTVGIQLQVSHAIEAAGAMATHTGLPGNRGKLKLLVQRNRLFFKITLQVSPIIPKVVTSTDNAVVNMYFMAMSDGL